MTLTQKLLKTALTRLDLDNNQAKVTETTLNAKSFGRKILSRVQIALPDTQVNLVTKQYTVQDMPMFLSGNSENRERLFFTSPLLEQMQKFFYVPTLAVSEDTLVMQDVSEELAAFGPPNMPAQEQMQAIIEAAARKDAATLDCQEPWLGSCSAVLTNTRRLFAALADNDTSPALAGQCREEWPWLTEGFAAFSAQYPGLAHKLLAVLADETICADLDKHPHSVQHGDFYFGNIGLTRAGRPVVIDWENVCRAPIGLDLASVTAGMPPLPFTDKYFHWYLEAFNSSSPISVSLEQVVQIQDDLKLWQFLTGEVLDMLHFGFWPQSPLPAGHKEKMQAEMVDQLSAL